MGKFRWSLPLLRNRTSWAWRWSHFCLVRERQCWRDRVLGIQDDLAVRCAVGGVPVSSVQRACR